MPCEAEMCMGGYCDMIPKSQNTEIRRVLQRHPLVHDGLLDMFPQQQTCIQQ
jgi:hypothetical protein